MASLLQAALCPSDMLTVYVCWHMYWQELDMAKLFGSMQHRETPDLCLYNLFGWSEDINPPLPPRSKAKSCTGPRLVSEMFTEQHDRQASRTFKRNYNKIHALAGPVC